MMQCLVLHQNDPLLQLESRDLLEPVEKEVLIQLQAAALNRRDFWICHQAAPALIGLFGVIAGPIFTLQVDK
mgnify:CR=1 FL=1